MDSGFTRNGYVVHYDFKVRLNLLIRNPSHIDENYHTPPQTPHTPRDLSHTITATNDNTAVTFTYTPVPKRRKVAREVSQDDLTFRKGTTGTRDCRGVKEAAGRRGKAQAGGQLQREAAEMYNLAIASENASIYIIHFRIKVMCHAHYVIRLHEAEPRRLQSSLICCTWLLVSTKGSLRRTTE